MFFSKIMKIFSSAAIMMCLTGWHMPSLAISPLDLTRQINRAYSKGDYDSAMKIFDANLENVRKHASSSSLLFCYALINSKLMNYNTSDTYFNLTIEVAKKNDFLPSKNSIYITYAQSMFDRGDYDRAISFYAEGLNEATNYYKRHIYTAMGETSRYLGKYDEAMKYFDKAIEADRNFASAYLAKGYLNIMNGEYNSAIEDLDKAVLLQAKNPYIYAYKGFAKTETGKYNEALKDLNTAISLKPKTALPFFYRAYLYAQKNDYEKSIADFNKALTLHTPLLYIDTITSIASNETVNIFEPWEDVRIRSVEYDAAQKTIKKMAEKFGEKINEKGLNESLLNHYAAGARNADKTMAGFYIQDFYVKKEYEKVIYLSDKFLKVYPVNKNNDFERNVYALKILSECSLPDYNREKLMMDIKNFIKISPNGGMNLVDKAQEQFIIGYKENKKTAYFLLDRYLEVDPNSSSALYTYANLLGTDGRYNEAMNYLDKLYKAKPSTDIKDYADDLKAKILEKMKNNNVN